MSNMVENVARALCEAASMNPNNWPHKAAAARAAIDEVFDWLIMHDLPPKAHAAGIAAMVEDLRDGEVPVVPRIVAATLRDLREAQTGIEPDIAAIVYENRSALYSDFAASPQPLSEEVK